LKIPFGGIEMKKILLLGIVALMLLHLPAVFAEGEDLEFLGLEVEKLFNLGSGLLAVALLALTFVAYKRTRKKRLFYVCAAFFVFAVKGFLVSSELFFGDWASAWIDPATSFLDFAILLSFFLGVIKK
jgi:hypothetical protein